MTLLFVFFGWTLGAGITAFIPLKNVASRWSGMAGVLQSLVLLAAALHMLAGTPWQWVLWHLDGWGTLTLTATPLGGFFLLVTSVVFLAVFLFSPGYIKRYAHTRDPRALYLVLHLLLASIALILTAGDIITFLIAWEVMSILSYFTVLFDHREGGTPRAAYVMLGASELGFLMVLAAWLPLALIAHSISFAIIAASAGALSSGFRWAVLLLSFFGFGVKAGLFPAMSWLPRAHPAAPANASAVLSGAILNLGIYGIILTDARLVPVSTVAASIVVLVVGALTAFIGILYAATDTHIKRLLAHSSIENMGLVTLALGAGFTFDALHLPVLGLLAWIAALYHLLNHSVYKTLLFLGAGAIDQATGELNMDQLGGLARRMRWTSVFLLAGTMSIAALPPFNGFASEWLILQSLLRSVAIPNPGIQVTFALVGVVVALTAGLAATAFIRFYGMTFLGHHRSDKAARGAEVALTERLALGFLAVLALLLGVLPTYVATGLSRVVGSVADGHALSAFVPPFFHARALAPGLAATFYPLGAGVGQGVLPGPGLVLMHPSTRLHAGVVFAMSPTYLVLAILIGLGLTLVLARALSPGRHVHFRRPWLGGVRAVDSGLTYTATGVARPIWVVFRAILSPSQTVDREEVVAEHFRVGIHREDTARYVVDRLIVDPAVWVALALARFLAKMHHGSINAYVGYAFFALLAAMVLVRLT